VLKSGQKFCRSRIGQKWPDAEHARAKIWYITFPPNIRTSYSGDKYTATNQTKFWRSRPRLQVAPQWSLSNHQHGCCCCCENDQVMTTANTLQLAAAASVNTVNSSESMRSEWYSESDSLAMIVRRCNGIVVYTKQIVGWPRHVSAKNNNGTNAARGRVSLSEMSKMEYDLMMTI